MVLVLYASKLKRHLPFALTTLRLLLGSSTSLLIVLLGVTSSFAALPSVPGTNEVVRYELYDWPSRTFQFKAIPRERGDALLSALDGGRQLREPAPCPTNMICDPAPPLYWLNVILTNGITNTIGISERFVVVSDSYYDLTDAASEKVTKVINQLDEDFRQEIVNAPKPLGYIVGSVDDGGTLSGIARVFYGDATKWKKIYEANRQTIKNPDKITGGMKLTIPKLQ